LALIMGRFLTLGVYGCRCMPCSASAPGELQVPAMCRMPQGERKFPHGVTTRSAGVEQCRAARRTANS
jgi:hypothetical protein